MPIDIATQESSVLAVVGLVFALGLRHGLDADHLVAIDGLTRYNAARNPHVARWCGAWFSLGHGLVVMAVALLAGSAASAWTMPPWLEDFGAWLSIAVLLLLGAVNLHAVLNTPPQRPMALAGVRSRLLARLLQASGPWPIALAGSAFAVSFDTLSQAALFALLAAQFGSWAYCALLGGVFAAGMILVDGCNGWWVFRLILNANRTALLASRAFGAVVALLSFGVAFLGMAAYFSPRIGDWSADRELAIGFGVIGIVAASYLGAIALSRLRQEKRA